MRLLILLLLCGTLNAIEMRIYVMGLLYRGPNATEWCDQDPAIQASTLRVELHQWYAAKGITYDKSSEKKP